MLLPGTGRADNCCCCLPSRFSRVQLCGTPWTAAYQASPSMGFSRQEHWSGLPFPSPRADNTVQFVGQGLWLPEVSPLTSLRQQSWDSKNSRASYGGSHMTFSKGKGVSLACDPLILLRSRETLKSQMRQQNRSSWTHECNLSFV